MIYLNSGTDVDALWADAKNKAAAERMARHGWMQNPIYPTAAGRGAVDGQLRTPTARTPPLRPQTPGSSLAAAQPDWQQQSSNYTLPARTKMDASTSAMFAPAPTSLYAFTDGVMHEFRRDGVTVKLAAPTISNFLIAKVKTTSSAFGRTAIYVNPGLSSTIKICLLISC